MRQSLQLNIRVILVSMLSFYCAVGFAVIPIPYVYSTGVDNSGVEITSGTLESHYVVTGTATASYGLTPHPNWLGGEFIWRSYSIGFKMDRACEQW